MIQTHSPHENIFLVFFSAAMRNTMTKSNVRKEGFTSAYRLPSPLAKEVITGT